jgi:hypothetical protein
LKTPALNPRKELLEPVKTDGQGAIEQLPPANAPINVLFVPVEFCPATYPKNELPLAVVFACPAFEPKNELAPPVLLNPAWLPKKALPIPLTFALPAPSPKNELSLPVVFCSPAL